MLYSSGACQQMFILKLTRKDGIWHMKPYFEVRTDNSTLFSELVEKCAQVDDV